MADQPIFLPEEFQARLHAMQTHMAQADIAAVLLTEEHDFRYFSGFLTRFWESPTRPWFLILPATGEPIAVIPSIGVALMETTWVKDIRSWPAPQPSDDGVSLLAETLGALLSDGGALGLPMGHETKLRMPLADYHRLESLLPPCAKIDVTGMLLDLQQVKSSAEIALIKDICKIAGNAFARMGDIVDIGKPLSAVFRDFQIELLSAGADYVPYIAGAAGQGGYADVISPATDTPLVAGDVLMLDTGAVRQGYFCDFDRNIAIGHATDAVNAAHDLLYRATDAGLAAAKPGARASDLFHAMQAVIAEQGGAGDAGRLGHGLGMRLTENPSLIPSDTTRLRPGMVLTLEPGYELSHGRIMVHEEDILITETGAEYLSPRVSRELPVIGETS